MFIVSAPTPIRVPFGGAELKQTGTMVETFRSSERRMHVFAFWVL